MDHSAEVDSSAYEWVDSWDPWGDIGCCIAAAEGISPLDALHRLVPHPVVGPAPAGQLREWQQSAPAVEFRNLIEAVEVEGWTVVVEGNGGQATREEPLAALSKGTKCGVVYWSINRDMTFLWSVHSTTIRRFDPLLYQDSASLPWSGEHLREEDGLVFGLPHPTSSAMALLERLTGIHLDLGLLDQRDEWMAVGYHPL